MVLTPVVKSLVWRQAHWQRCTKLLARLQNALPYDMGGMTAKPCVNTAAILSSRCTC